jgi:hypothetical protein
METVKLATRRWWYIMPIVFITYSLAYLDAAGCTVFPRLLFLPGAGGDLRAETQR